MLKMLVQVRRKPGLDDTTFYARWQDEHGRLVAHHASAMAFLAYVQTHRIGDRTMIIGDLTADTTIDGQAALWWPDSNAMFEALSSASGVAASAELEIDEQAFTDTRALSAFAATETLVVGSQRAAKTTRKLMLELRRPGDTDLQSYDDQHPLLVDHVRQLSDDTAATRAVINSPDRSVAFDFAADRGWLSPPDGIVELWLPAGSAVGPNLSTTVLDSALDRFLSGTAAIVDQTQTTAYFGEDRQIFDHR